MRIRSVVVVALSALLTVGAFVPASVALAPAAPATWQLRVAPLPAGVTATAKTTASVSCATAVACTLLVSSARTADKTSINVADMRTGERLVPQVLPQPAGAPASPNRTSISGVSCTTLPLCVAVGRQPNGDGLLENYDGTSWTAQDDPLPAPLHHEIVDVACAPERCIAVAYFLDYPANLVGTVYERDNSTGLWTRPADSLGEQVSPTSNRYDNLYSAFSPACAPTGACYALSYGGYNGQFTNPDLIRRTASGSYTYTPLPVPPGVDPADLKLGGMACAAETDCATIGTYVNASATRQYLVAEVLRGGVLEADPILIPASLRSLADPLEPRAISCPAVNNCVGVVGFRNSSAAHGALLVRYDGTRWSARLAPAPTDATGTDAVDLTGVDCVSVLSCVATGFYLRETANGAVARPLLETLSGTSWTASSPAIPPSLPQTAQVRLEEVSCASTSCLAEGTFQVPGGRAGVIAGLAVRVPR